MAITLSQNNYGKSSVRLAKITRHADFHDFKEMTVNIQLSGDFEKAYTDGDNRTVLPTDTMKNTVYALAKDHPLHTIEEFGLMLAQYFVKNNSQVSDARIEIIESLWRRVHGPRDRQSEQRHPHAFLSGGNEKASTSITHSHLASSVSSGISGLLILKTTDSGFENFLKDRFTTLKEASDRIMATSLKATWDYDKNDVDFAETRKKIRELIIQTFAHHKSLSVQHTQFAIGRAILENCPEVSEIHLSMPNKHYLPFDLERFGIENQNEIFVPTDEPFGLIEARLTRE